MKPKKIWANFSVKDVKRTNQFYTELGFTSNRSNTYPKLASFLFGEDDFVIKRVIKIYKILAPFKLKNFRAFADYISFFVSKIYSYFLYKINRMSQGVTGHGLLMRKTLKSLLIINLTFYNMKDLLIS